jgi:PAS domain S-box-containing protein
MPPRSTPPKHESADAHRPGVDNRKWSSREWLALILDGIADGVTAQDAAGHLIYANDAAARTSGYPSPEAMLAAPPTDFLKRFEVLDDAGSPFPLDRLPGRRALAGEEAPETTLRYRDRRTGEERWSVVRARPVFDEEGRVRIAISIFRDVTESVRQQRTLEETAAELEIAVSDLGARTEESESARDRVTAVLESITDAFVSYDENWRILYANDRAAQSFAALGCDRETLIGKVLWELLPDLAGTPFHTHGLRAMAEGRALEFEQYHPRLGQWLAVRLYPSKEGLSAFARDITEHKQRESTLRVLAEAGKGLAGSLDYETSLRSVTGLLVPEWADWCFVDLAMPGGFRRLAVAHADPAHVEAARGLEREYASNRVAAIGVSEVIRSGRSQLVPEVPEELFPSLARDEEHLATLRALGLYSAIIVALVARGKTLGALSLIRSTPARGRYTEDDLAFAEELGRRTALAADNARLFAAEQQAQKRAMFLAEGSRLLASSLDYEATLQSVTQLAVPILADWCGIELVREDGTFQLVGVAHVDPEKAHWARELHRQRPPEKDPRSVVAKVVRTGESHFISVMTDAMLVAAARSPEELALYRGIGFRSFICVPMISRGRTVGAISFVRTQESARHYDEADLTLAEDVARRAASAIDNALLYGEAVGANQAKADFLAVMSHELRTPLTAIIGYAELLADEIVGPVNEAQKEQISRVRASGAHLLTLIEEILTFARIEAGQETVRAERVELVELVRETVAIVEPIAARKRLTLDVRAQDASLVIETDGVKVRQILLNLLANAIKFTDAGTVIVELQRAQGRVDVAVHDTGIGIARDHLETIFEPFWQVEQVRTRKVGGTGLGLSVARQLARLLGGDVTAESEVGKGSVFRCWVPVRTNE